MGHQKIRKEQKEKDDQKINSRYFGAKKSIVLTVGGKPKSRKPRRKRPKIRVREKREV